jgi:nucleoside-diphosphate-sugar epimerase
MRVFVTGATGFIGSAVVRELLDAGHQVVGLARSDAGAAAVAAAGAEVLRGDLDDLDGLRRGAAESDGVIHTAFTHDFSDWLAAIQADRRAIEAMGEALAGSGRPLVVASGAAALASGRAGTEEDPTDPAWPRAVSDEMAMSFVERGVRVSLVRLPPTTHGEGDHGFVHILVDVARAKGVSAYPGDGTNRWAATHRVDAARLFRLAVESAPAGTRVHAIAEEEVPVRDIAEAIGRQLNLPVESIPVAEAGDHFGFIGPFFARDLWLSSTLTRERFGWRPTQPTLAEDLEKGHYFSE